MATETVAMGLNLPARTVLFTSVTKFDGHERRLLRATEYTQMAGRAGRRGIDSRGAAVLMIREWLSAHDGEAVLSRRYAPLISRYAPRYSTLLNLARSEDVSATALLGRSLAAWQARDRAEISSRYRRRYVAERCCRDRIADRPPQASASSAIFADKRRRMLSESSAIAAAVNEHTELYTYAEKILRVNAEI